MTTELALSLNIPYGIPFGDYALRGGPRGKSHVELLISIICQYKIENRYSRNTKKMVKSILISSTPFNNENRPKRWKNTRNQSTKRTERLFVCHKTCKNMFIEKNVVFFDKWKKNHMFLTKKCKKLINISTQNAYLLSMYYLHICHMEISENS